MAQLQGQSGDRPRGRRKSTPAGERRGPGGYTYPRGGTRGPSPDRIAEPVVHLRLQRCQAISPADEAELHGIIVSSGSSSSSSPSPIRELIRQTAAHNDSRVNHPSNHSSWLVVRRPVWKWRRRREETRWCAKAASATWFDIARAATCKEDHVRKRSGGSERNEEGGDCGRAKSRNTLCLHVVPPFLSSSPPFPALPFKTQGGGNKSSLHYNVKSSGRASLSGLSTVKLVCLCPRSSAFVNGGAVAGTNTDATTVATGLK